MRLSNTQAVARPTYYDRNPITKWLTYQFTGIAPHAFTIRWTYTVPAGRRCFIEGSFMKVRRDSAATAAVQAESVLRYTPSGGSVAQYATAEVNTNAIGDHESLVPGALSELGPGDVLDGGTLDGSTGGTLSYFNNTKGTEFDL